MTQDKTVNETILSSRWFVAVDDLIGGWAVSTVDKPTSDLRPDRGEYVACYMPLSYEIADRIVWLHNQHLTEIGELL